MRNNSTRQKGKQIQLYNINVSSTTKVGYNFFPTKVGKP